jgi:hypothetical protein
VRDRIGRRASAGRRAIGAGRSPFAELGEHLKLDVVDEERFSSGALAQILVPKR